MTSTYLFRLAGLLTITLFSTCAGPTSESSTATRFYIVANNTRGLREGFLEIGNVVEFNDSSMLVREPGHPDWSKRYGMHARTIQAGMHGEWEWRGDTLAGPEGNDYALRPLPPSGEGLVDSLLRQGVRYRVGQSFSGANRMYSFSPMDGTGLGCMSSYVAELSGSSLPPNSRALPKAVRERIGVFHSYPPVHGQYRYSNELGRPLLIEATQQGRTVYDVQAANEDSLTLIAYRSVSPTSKRKEPTVWTRQYPSDSIARPGGEVNWEPWQDDRLDSLRWGRDSEASFAAKHPLSFWDFELGDLSLRSEPGYLSLYVGERQVWRRSVHPVAGDLLRATADECRDAEIFPLRDAGEDGPIIHVPLLLRRAAYDEEIDINGRKETMRFVPSQFRMQPFCLSDGSPL